MRQLILIAHDIRSTHNVGSLLRTADGLGLAKIILTGYTPFPAAKLDKRLPHLVRKIDQQISKTALGAEKTVRWQQDDNISEVIADLKYRGYIIAALEQAPGSQVLFEYQPPNKLAVIIGNEVKGLDAELVKLCDVILEIPMLGDKESFNVVQAAAMALYHCRFTS